MLMQMDENLQQQKRIKGLAYIVKEVITCDISPEAMFIFSNG